MSHAERIRLINAVKFGPDELRFHVRDQERYTSRLPPCVVALLPESTPVPIELGAHRGTIDLPDVAHAVAPSDTDLLNWSWPDGASILLMTGTLADLPLLDSLDETPGATCLNVNGRPLLVELRENQTRDLYVARIDGFLDDRSSLSVNIFAPNAERRAVLVAALATLQTKRISQGA